MSKDLTGQRYGMLTVVELEVAAPWSKRRWKCKCDCGNYCTRLESSLHNSARDNRISNCGCITKSFLKAGDSKLCSKAGRHRKDSFVNESNIQMTLREGTISTNSSGCQGVSWSNSANKWHCYVGYQSYRCNLGFYENKEDAVKIRHLAETAIQENTFEEFFFSIRGHHLGEKQRKLFKNR